MKENNKFKENLTLIAMDEAHTIWRNGEFRGEFNRIGKIRDFFPGIPMVALSATFPPHVMTLVHKVLGMSYPSDIITCNGRRTNINLLVAEQPSRNTFQPLLDLIPNNIKRIHKIPKTLIFVDSVVTARRIAISLRKKLHYKLPSCNQFNAIRTYYSSIDQPMKQRTYELIKNGEARLIICTDSMSLGVDVSDIMRVIQWGVNEKLDLDTLVQRFGRAVRDQKLQGVGVVYAPKDIINPVPKYSTQQWIIESHELNETPEDAVTGTNDEWEDEDGIIPCYRSRDLSRFSLPVTHETGQQVNRLRSHMYRKAQDFKNLRKEAASERKPLKPRGIAPARGPKRQPVESIDPAVLWFLNTTGCRHRCILSYLKYPDVFDDAAQKSWCCDNCALAKGPDSEITAGVSVSDSFFSIHDSAPTHHRETRIAPIIPHRIIKKKQKLESLLEQDLKLWRKGLLRKLIDREVIWSGCPEGVVLPDAVITKVVKGIKEIHSPSDLNIPFKKAKYSVKSGILRGKDIIEIFNIIELRITAHMALGIYLYNAKLMTVLSESTPKYPPALVEKKISTNTASPPLTTIPPYHNVGQRAALPPAPLVGPAESQAPLLQSPAVSQQITTTVDGKLANTKIIPKKRVSGPVLGSSKRRKPLNDITNRGSHYHLVDQAIPAENVTGSPKKCTLPHAGISNQRIRKPRLTLSPFKRRGNTTFDIASISNESRLGSNKRIIKPSRTIREEKEI
jgi:Helicase conserved C-terminal domain